MADLALALYYRNRERQSLRLAQEATNETVASIHMELAERYGELAAGSVPVPAEEVWHRISS